ncbi:hypothetical protein QN277_005517 [Acacia crassicarpa]|uniref:Transcription factor CBF/NF-Y/archaeal histone domain-containing protein n=1 Tax=Acacia crassicarpa TaxID=499986 RepID=A0AAE1IXB4_9FABA|nr:hypothetical protein QN277_005517 [Acacia crassicarpa]
MAASRGQRNSAGRVSGGSREKTLPLTAVGKIMKNVLPAGARISKEAKESVQECSSKFAAVILNRAIQECEDEESPEVNGGHIILALTYYGLGDYVYQLMNDLYQFWNIDEPEPEPEPEPVQERSTRPTLECRLHRFRDGGDYPKGILAVRTAESVQHVSALILRRMIY